MLVKVFPRGGVIVDLPFKVADNLIKQGQGEAVSKKVAKSLNASPENKALAGAKTTKKKKVKR